MKRQITILIILAMALTAPLAAMAQKAKRTAAPKKKAPVTAVKEEEEKEEDPLMEQMLTAVEKVVFVDSIVVTKKQMLSALFPNPEEGRLATYEDFFKTKNGAGGYVYVNELGNHCIFSKPDSQGRMWLYSSDLLGGKWSEPEKLKGLDTKLFVEMNYPYLMTDGMTLYFAARGTGSLGGFDIYRTRLDTETGRYLKPENIGMPFCSENDDFFYIIDEQNRLGYFVTNRRQPSGKVCVYTFVPNEARSVYNSDDMDEEKLRSMARINSMADTWGDDAVRRDALRRMANRNTPKANRTADERQTKLAFVVNDETVYTKPSDFKKPELFREWQAASAKADELETTLQRLREQFAAATATGQEKLRPEILTCEQRLIATHQLMKQKEKEIRKTENNQ